MADRGCLHLDTSSMSADCGIYSMSPFWAYKIRSRTVQNVVTSLYESAVEFDDIFGYLLNVL